MKPVSKTFQRNVDELESRQVLTFIVSKWRGSSRDS